MQGHFGFRIHCAFDCGGDLKLQRSKLFIVRQGCGNTMPDLFDLVQFHSGQVENFNLLVLGQVQNLYKVNKILYFIF